MESQEYAPITVTELVDNDMPTLRQPRLNLAIGPNCPVRCEGCYNNFGETESTGGLITADQVLGFAQEIGKRGIDGVTLSGGDPLFHPEIMDILAGLKDLGYRTKVDTVGTSFLEDPRIIFKGRGMKPQIDVRAIKDLVESVTVPLDGIDQETIEAFRKGRRNLFEETKLLSDLFTSHNITFGFNTVANTSNVSQLEAIGSLAFTLGASEWHIFEYDNTGPNTSAHKSSLTLAPHQFEAATTDLRELPFTGMKIDIRSKSSRTGAGAYFFVNDAGEAWCPGDEGEPIRYGHIVGDRDRILGAYDTYLANFRERATETTLKPSLNVAHVITPS